MSQLRRYDPFAIEPVGDMFQGLLRSFRGGVDGALPFKVDVTESDTAYNVVAEIPGAKKEDIDVTVDRGTVMLSAKVERQSEKKEGERVIRSERYSGSMQRLNSSRSAAVGLRPSAMSTRCTPKPQTGAVGGSR